MVELRTQELIKRSGQVFKGKDSLNDLWQELALQFYPQRANFTTSANLGEEYASHLATTYTVRAARDLANSLASMLRPPEVEWFKVRPKNEELRGNVGVMEWCEYATGAMRKVMLDPKSKFSRATKECDRDYSVFGQGALTIEMNIQMNGPLYRCWHLRDLAWEEDAEGTIDTVFRKWTPTARNLKKEFPKTVPQQVLDMIQQDPDQRVNCLHVVMPAEDYDWGEGKKKRRNAERFPVMECYIDVDHQTILEEKPLRQSPWVIPRWSTVSDSQYAYSDAADGSIADARTLQAQMDTILEQGEKSVDPPMIAKRDLFQSPMNVYPGGVTYADLEGDEKLGDVIQLMQPNREGMVSGQELLADMRTQIADGWYLNKLFLPPYDPGEKMTAYEVQRRMQEFVRQALPLFEPIETEYNNPLCEKTFLILMQHGGFDLSSMPDELKGQDVEFVFTSPLKDATDRADVDRYSQAVEMTAAAAQIDPGVVDNFDNNTAYRKAMSGLGAPPNWLVPMKDVVKKREEQQPAQQAADAGLALTAAGQVAKSVGEGMGAVREAIAPPAEMPPGAVVQ